MAGRADLIVVPNADDEISDRLKDEPATVISGDRFRDLMKRGEVRSSDVRQFLIVGGRVEFRGPGSRIRILEREVAVHPFI
jgi:hypothetical protein